MNAAPFPQLHVFLAVARHRSFSGAARELGVTRSAVSQSVPQLETQLRVPLFARTTRAVSLTDAGRRLVEGAGPAMSQALASLAEVSAQPGEAVGRVRLSVPHAALPFVITPVLPTFRARHPRVEVEVTVEDRLVDIVTEGYDVCAVRLSESIEREDGAGGHRPAPASWWSDRPRTSRAAVSRSAPRTLTHECITFRSATTGALYAWELERGRRNWRVPVRGLVVTGDTALPLALAEAGAGLAYVFEPTADARVRAGALQRVLEPYAPTVPGFFLYYPSGASRSAPLRLFIDAAKELSLRALRP
ncbi:MAG: LysR family transcriptional regulator [Polyangiales bacterium]